MQLRLDVSATAGGRVLATYADNDLQVGLVATDCTSMMLPSPDVLSLPACALQRLPEPLIIRPLARAEYFEV